jgi:hypothetical protein
MVQAGNLYAGELFHNTLLKFFNNITETGHIAQQWKRNIVLLIFTNVKVKLSRYTPWRHMGGGEV